MMTLVKQLFLLSLWLGVSYSFSFQSQITHVPRRSVLFASPPSPRREKATNNIFNAYVQNRVLEEPHGPVESEPMLPIVKKIAQVADMRKATNIVALRVSHLTEITRFMVLVEASNSRQIQAISDTVEEDVLSQCGVAPHVKEGTAASGWQVLDYGGVLVHIMSAAMRNFYKLEKRWINAERVDLSSVLQQPSPVHSAHTDPYFAGNDGGSGRDRDGAYIDHVDRGALNADDLAFWGEDELVQQMQVQQVQQMAKNKAQEVKEVPALSTNSLLQGRRAPFMKAAATPSRKIREAAAAAAATAANADSASALPRKKRASSKITVASVASTDVGAADGNLLVVGAGVDVDVSAPVKVPAKRGRPRKTPLITVDIVAANADVAVVDGVAGVMSGGADVRGAPARTDSASKPAPAVAVTVAVNPNSKNSVSSSAGSSSILDEFY